MPLRSDALTPALSHGRGSLSPLRSDALTPALSHGRGSLGLCGLMPSPQPSPTGEGLHTKNDSLGLLFAFS